MTASTLGARLRAIRRHLDMNQVTFAVEMGCTQSFISHIEHNRSGPSAPLLAALEGRGYSGSWLLTGKPPMLRSTTSIPSTSFTSDSSAPSDPSDSFLTRDALPSLPPSSILLLLSSSEPLTAGDVLLVRIEKSPTPVKKVMPATILNLIPHRK